jgi:hypothetical protein
MAWALMYVAIAWVLVLLLVEGTGLKPRDRGGLLVDFRPYAAPSRC